MSAAIVVRRGMSISDACRAARRLGAKIDYQHGGEIRFEHPLAGRCVSGTGRKDASVALVTWLRRAWSAKVADVLLEEAG